MRVFVCEFVTGGGFSTTRLPDGLCREGDIMLRALVKDLAELPQLTICAARDRRLAALDFPAEHLWIEPGEDPWPAWHWHMAAADAVLPVAPETGGVLERLSALVQQTGRRLLGSRPGAVHLTARKLLTATHLTGHGIPAVPTEPLAAALSKGARTGSGSWVVKPDDGAGSEETFLLHGTAALRSWAARCDDIGRFVVQPFLAGAATSLSLLCGDGRAMILGCNSQDVRIDRGQFHYHGGVVGGREQGRPLYEPIAARIAAAIPELWGLVGVDLVETANGPIVLEVNPRVTTSYAGLRQALQYNPAELLLQLAAVGWEAVTAPPHPREQVVRLDAGSK